MELRAIGTVVSDVTEGVDEGWGEVVAELHLAPELADGLSGLEGFSHLLVVFFMHGAAFVPEQHLRRRPQGREAMPELGIFAQRAKHRPNPIGVTAVRLLAREGNVLRVQGLDAIDGSPVLDIKPYFPPFDRVPEATTPGWVERLMRDYF